MKPTSIPTRSAANPSTRCSTVRRTGAKYFRNDPASLARGLAKTLSHHYHTWKGAGGVLHPARRQHPTSKHCGDNPNMTAAEEMTSPHTRGPGQVHLEQLGDVTAGRSRRGRAARHPGGRQLSPGRVLGAPWIHSICLTSARDQQDRDPTRGPAPWTTSSRLERRRPSVSSGSADRHATHCGRGSAPPSARPSEHARSGDLYRRQGV